MVEAKPAIRKPHYLFSEQVDPDTNIPVALVPLEAIPWCEIADSLPHKPKIVEPGVGKLASVKYLLSKLPSEKRKGAELITSDPFPEDNLSSHFPEIEREVASHSFYRETANDTLKKERDCDVIDMINIIHLVPPEERKELGNLAARALAPGGIVIISTSFIKLFNPDNATYLFHQAWKNGLLKEAKKRGLDIHKLFEDIRSHRLEFWDAEQYVALFQEAGLEIVFPQRTQPLDYQTMPCNGESYRRISMDGEWTKYTLPGVPYRAAAVISFTSAKNFLRTKEEFDQYPLPRNTLVLVARKPLREVTNL